MKVRTIITVSFFVLVACGYLWSWRSVDAVTAQQKRVRPAAPVRTVPAPPAGKDYSKFSHRSAEHLKLNCRDCHQAPSANWTKQSDIPDITDYPRHEDCVRCHRAEFYKGARPVMCTICHVKVSPRDEARSAFTQPTTEFQTQFSHNQHQDVIAALPLNRGAESAHASRAQGPAQTASAPKYNNCEICHVRESDKIVHAAFDGFTPPAGTYMTAPTGHASCFNCHYQIESAPGDPPSRVPTRNDCEKCHVLLKADAAVLSLPVTIVRKSLKFQHVDAKENHIFDCTRCHINITRVTSVERLQPDVPISRCATCHNHVDTLQSEVKARLGTPSVTCSKCHTDSVSKKTDATGKIYIPADHCALDVGCAK